MEHLMTQKNIFLIIIVIVLLICLELKFFVESKSERFTNNSNDLKKNILFKKCLKYGTHGTLSEIFDKHDIQKCKGKECYDKWNLYIPCGYNNVENELEKIKISNNKQIIFGIKGCDKIASKNNIWKLLIEKYGRTQAKKFMPDTYLTQDKNDMFNFRMNFHPTKLYIMKKNIQRQKGLKITNNLEEIIKNSGCLSDYRIVQELLQDPFVLNGRKINLRIYLLIICSKGLVKSYIHNNGFMYYTPKKFIKKSMEKNVNITSGYVPRQVYKENPLTLEDFRHWLDKNGFSKDKLDHNIEILFKNIMNAVVKSLCKIKSLKNNTTFQLFGADVAPNKYLEVQLMEINKGPDMGAKDEKDQNIKIKVQEDMFDLLKVIKGDGKNSFKQVWEFVNY